jgi:hypothetical protein
MFVIQHNAYHFERSAPRSAGVSGGKSSPDYLDYDQARHRRPTMFALTPCPTYLIGTAGELFTASTGLACYSIESICQLNSVLNHFEALRVDGYVGRLCSPVFSAGISG